MDFDGFLLKINSRLKGERRMFREMLTKKWVPDVRLANPVKVEEIRKECEESKAEGKFFNDYGYYGNFYAELNRRISKMEKLLEKASGYVDQDRFPSFGCHYISDSGKEFEVSVKGSATIERGDYWNCATYAAADLSLVEIIEREVDWEVTLYNDFDANEEKFRSLGKRVEELGGIIELRRPLVNVVLPDLLGYNVYELTPCMFNYERIATSVGILEKQRGVYDE